MYRQLFTSQQSRQIKGYEREPAQFQRKFIYYYLNLKDKKRDFFLIEMNPRLRLGTLSKV